MEHCRDPEAFGSNEELVALLGRYLDRIVAERAGVSVQAVAEERRRRGIAAIPYRPRRIRWTPEMIAALGTASDSAVGAAFGISKYAVRSKRQTLDIPSYHPPCHRAEGRRWTREELALLGKGPDKEVAETVGLHWSTVNRKRRQLGIAAFQPTPHRFDWTEEPVALLGTAPDAKVAAVLGISAATVLKERQRRGIPAHKETRRVVVTPALIDVLHLPTCEVTARTGLRNHTITRLRRRLGIEAPSLSTWRWRPAIPRLGREPDARIATDLGLSAKRVAQKRKELGIPPPQRPRRVWKDEEIALLGTAPDKVIAVRLGRSQGSVYQKREKLGIPRVDATRRAGQRRAETEEDADARGRRAK